MQFRGQGLNTSVPKEVGEVNRVGPPRCFFCDRLGHMKSECQERKKWLESKDKAQTVKKVSDNEDDAVCRFASIKIDDDDQDSDDYYDYTGYYDYKYYYY